MHVWQDYLEQAEDIRHSPLGKATYALRSQTIERVFADAKEKHAMRYTPYRGLAAVTAWVKLKFAALNLKKLAIHRWLCLLFSDLLLMLEATSLCCEVASDHQQSPSSVPQSTGVFFLNQKEKGQAVSNR